MALIGLLATVVVVLLLLGLGWAQLKYRALQYLFSSAFRCCSGRSASRCR
jgi:hypothetical protein